MFSCLRYTSPAISRLSQISSRIHKTQSRNMSSGTLLKLKTGASIPAIGFGTWQDKADQERAVAEALKAGCRHIDTARIYGTEPAVGAAIKKSGIPRSEIFITTKLWNHKHAPEDVEPALDASLKDLGTDYVNLYLMHWPVAFRSGEESFPKTEDGKNAVNEDITYLDTWKAMEKLLKTGKTKAIGISNFSKREIETLLEKGSVVPAAHQIECHPWLQQKEFTEWQREQGIVIQHYSPFGNQNEVYDSGKKLGKLMDDPVLVEIGKKYNKTGAHVALAWGVTQGHAVLPKSKTPSRIRSNMEGDFILDKEDMEKIAKIDKKTRFNDPSGSFGYNFFADLDGKEKK